MAIRTSQVFTYFVFGDVRQTKTAVSSAV